MKLIYLHLLQALRSMRRNYLQTLLSAVGLIIGFSSFVFACNWLRYDMTYDMFRPDSKNIHVVCNNQFPPMLNFSQSYPMYKFLRDSVPGVTDVAIMGWPEMEYLTDANDRDLKEFAPKICIANSSFLKIMGVKLLYGEPETALSRRDGVVITRKMAQKIFQRENVLGENINAKRNFADNPAIHTLTITGVAENCYTHTSMPFDLLMAMDNFSTKWWDKWDNNEFNLFFKTVNGADTDRRLRERLLNGKNNIFFTTPLSHMKYSSGMREGLKYPIYAVAISILLLLSALFNYVAILTAQFMNRFREYRLRISLGGTFTSNSGWLYSEVFIMFLLMILGTYVLLEQFSAWSGVPDNKTTLFQTLAYLTPLGCLLLFLAAIYPLIRLRYVYYRSFLGEMPVKGANASSVFVQVAVCCLFLFIFINIYRQFYLMTHTNLGFNYERVIRVFTRDSPFNVPLIESMLQELRSEQGGPIEDVVSSPSSVFQSRQYQGASLSWAKGDEGVQSCMIQVPPKVFQFFGIRPVTGKIYNCEEVAGIKQIMLNKDAADLIHFTERSGSQLSDFGKNVEVTGVVDFYACNLKNEPFAVVYYYTEAEATDHNHEVMFVRYKEGKYAQAMLLIQEMVSKRGISPEVVDIGKMDSYITSFYEEEARILRLIGLILFSSIFITLTGVLSQISYTLRMHRKFIAVRCVFGATYADLCRKYLRGYVLLSVIACMVSFPIGYHLITQWLQGYRSPVSVGVFECIWIGLSLLTLIVMIIAVRLKRALNENPAEIIKSE